MALERHPVHRQRSDCIEILEAFAKLLYNDGVGLGKWIAPDRMIKTE